MVYEALWLLFFLYVVGVDFYFSLFNEVLIIYVGKVFWAIVGPFVITLSSLLWAFVAVIASVWEVGTVVTASSNSSDVSVPWVDSSVVFCEIVAWVSNAGVSVAVVSITIVIMMVFVFVISVDDGVRIWVPAEEVWYIVLWCGCVWGDNNWLFMMRFFRVVRAVMGVVRLGVVV